MKNIIYIALVGIFLILVSGCTKTPINGNLDGEWEVMEVFPSPPEINLETRYFYNFQLHVCQLTVYGGPFAYGNLSYNGEIMSLDFPYIENESQELMLKQYGIYTNPITFNVEFEGKTRLILSNDDVYIVLRKF